MPGSCLPLSILVPATAGPRPVMTILTISRGAVTLAIFAALQLALNSGRAGQIEPAQSVEWRFDRLANIGGHKTTVLGDPTVIDSPVGKAVLFDGLDDALFIENHPLAGASTFTFEAIFRPDGGAFEQRWFHLSERDPKTGADTENRMLLEIRVVGDKWYLDSFNQSGRESRALMNRNALHPLGGWHHVASVYDGKEFRNYVDGVQEGSAQIQLAPHGPGHTSVGVRINKVFYFKGAVHRARFTRRALSPSEFLPPPALHAYQVPYARPAAETRAWKHDGIGTSVSLAEVVRRVKPIGASTAGDSFTEAIVREMAAHTERPIIFALSNPPVRAEANPADLIAWADGRTLSATGSPFGAVTYKGVTYVIAQVNNAMLYTGLGLGAIVSRASRISDGIFAAAASAVSSLVTVRQPGASLRPHIDDLRSVSATVAVAVAEAADAEGLAGVKFGDIVQQVRNAMWHPEYRRIHAS